MAKLFSKEKDIVLKVINSILVIWLIAAIVITFGVGIRIFNKDVTLSYSDYSKQICDLDKIPTEEIDQQTIKDNCYASYIAEKKENESYMNFSEQCFRIFEQATEAYHVTDNVDATVHNPYAVKSIEFYLYLKNWIDAVQWHLEDIIRNPEIDPVEALAIKRRIDKSNQDRTDLVELIDSFFLDKYKNVKVLPDATINTESPAWAIDRLSILTLKIYHMREEANRPDATAEHKARCEQKLAVLMEQKKDLSMALDQLLSDIRDGKKYMKVYKQMKMYNDPALNPVLYGKK